MPIMTPAEQRAIDNDSVYLIVRHQKKTIMFYLRETDSIHRVKAVLQPLIKVAPENQRIYKAEDEGLPLEDGARLSDCGITAQTAKAQQPVELHLVLRQDNGQFENINIVPYSNPPPLPDVMKESTQT